MGWFALLALPLHHDEPVDPTLLEWVKGLLDHFFGGGPWLMALLLGAIIVLVPVGLVVFYFTQRRHADDGISADPPETPA